MESVLVVGGLIVKANSEADVLQQRSLIKCIPIELNMELQKSATNTNGCSVAFVNIILHCLVIAQFELYNASLTWKSTRSAIVQCNRLDTR